jgi:prepilin-type N-terminal cleavage/methylation domain-containing protein
MIDNERGFSLVEILVAAALIAIGFVALLRVVPLAAAGLQQGNQQSTATHLAQQRLEQARAAVWTAVPLPGTDCLGVSAGNAAPVPSGAACTTAISETYVAGTNVTFPDESAVAGFPGYARTTRITDCGAGAGCSGIVYAPVPGTGTAAPRLVTVTVTYEGSGSPGATSRTRTVRLEWMVAQR